MRLFLAAVLSLTLTGCSLTTTATPSIDPPQVAPAISGVLHGGQQPISGAHVYLFAAGTTGHGGPGIAPYYNSATDNNQSVSLLSESVTGLSDSVGAYVKTTPSGNFTIPTYTCTPGTQVYLYGLGGVPANSGANCASGLLAALGTCPSAGNLTSTVPYIAVNEITTIAAAYAFANATNLVDVATGAALTTTPAGNGTVPQGEIQTLADILAYCVNSNDINSSTISSDCSSLFAFTRFSGTSGTTLTDTASAAINIAHNPGANVASLYPLGTGAVPYMTNPTYAKPNDFTLGLSFTGGGISSPAGIAVDGSGHVWIANFGGSSVIKLASSGAILSGSNGYEGGGIDGPEGIAVDETGNVWTPSYSNSSVSELSSSGSLLSLPDGYGGGGLNHPRAIAIDASGNSWIGNQIGNSITKLDLPNLTEYGQGAVTGPYGDAIAVDGSGKVWVSNTGSTQVAAFTNLGSLLSGSNGYSGGGIDQPYGVAIDQAGDVWVTNQKSNSVTKLSHSGNSLSGNNGFTGGGLDYPYGIAIDGSGSAWIANYYGSGVIELSSSGAFLSGTNGFTGSGQYAPFHIAIDGSGDVWMSNYYSNSITELIGGGTPVITPICAGLPATPTSDGSSNLGTRP